jgi:hypothetical protein
MSNNKPILPRVALAIGGATFAFVEVVLGAQDAAQALQAQAPTIEDSIVVTSTATTYQAPIFDTRSLVFSLDSVRLPPKAPFTINTKSS